jgi:lipoate-protein ligase A
LESYRKISEKVAAALRGLGRPVELSNERHPGIEKGHCFSAPSFAEITFRGKKVAGSAQAREGHKFLQQGVILLSVDSQWETLFPKNPEAAMAGLNEDRGVSPVRREDVEKAIRGSFEQSGVLFEEPEVNSAREADPLCSREGMA